MRAVSAARHPSGSARPGFELQRELWRCVPNRRGEVLGIEEGWDGGRRAGAAPSGLAGAPAAQPEPAWRDCNCADAEVRLAKRDGDSSVSGVRLVVTGQVRALVGPEGGEEELVVMRAERDTVVFPLNPRSHVRDLRVLLEEGGEFGLRFILAPLRRERSHAPVAQNPDTDGVTRALGIIRLGLGLGVELAEATTIDEPPGLPPRAAVAPTVTR